MLGRRGRVGRDLRTVLFTDIVGSTEQATELGDRRWRELLAGHHALVRRELRRHGGREMDTAGDGFFATFDRPADALSCAAAIAGGIRALGLRIRVGIHTGEVEQMGGKAGGIAVHVAARIVAEASPGEILVSSTVRDLVGGSGFRFEDRGLHTLKGMAEPWHLYALEVPAEEPATEARESAGVGRGRPLGGRGLVLAAAGVIVLFGAGLFYLATGLSPRPGATPTLAATASPMTGPNTLVALGASGQIEAGVAIGAGPRAIAVGDGAVWVASLAGQTVTRLDLATSRVDGIGGVGSPGAIAIDPNGAVWVADKVGSSLFALRADGQHLAEISGLHGTALAIGFGTVWLADDIHDQLARADLGSHAALPPIPLPAGSEPNGVVVAAGSVWVTGGLSKQLYRIDPTSAQVVGAGTALLDPPTSVWATDQAIWIASSSAASVTRVDPTTGQVSLAPVGVCADPSGGAVAVSGTWLACRGTLQLWLLSDSGAPSSKFPVGAPPEAVAVAGGAQGQSVWVALGEP